MYNYTVEPITDPPTRGQPLYKGSCMWDSKTWRRSGCDTVEKLQDVLVLEQFVNTLPADVRVWVQEHKPNTSEVAAQLADDYLQARKSHPLAGSEERKVRPLSQIVCAKCKKEGHKAKETSTGRQYDWSEGGVFDFSDSLFVSSLLFQFVLPIALC